MLHSFLLPLLLLAGAGADGKTSGAAAPRTETRELTPAQVEARTLANQARTRLRNGAAAEGLELARRAIGLDRRCVLASQVAGWCAVALKDDRAAVRHLTDGLDLDPADGELQFLVASCHQRLKEWGAAKDLLADLVKKHGADTKLLLAIAGCCEGEEDYAGAVATLLQARKLAPADRTIGERLVDVHEKRGDFEAAAVELQALVAASPQSAPLRYRLAQEWFELKRFDAAAQVLEDAARALGDDPQPHRMLVTLYAEQVPDATRLEFHRGWLKEWSVRQR